MTALILGLLMGPERTWTIAGAYHARLPAKWTPDAPDGPGRAKTGAFHASDGGRLRLAYVALAPKAALDAFANVSETRHGKGVSVSTSTFQNNGERGYVVIVRGGPSSHMRLGVARDGSTRALEIDAGRDDVLPTDAEAKRILEGLA